MRPGNLQVIRLLVEHGVDINTKNAVSESNHIRLWFLIVSYMLSHNFFSNFSWAGLVL